MTSLEYSLKSGVWVYPKEYNINMLPDEFKKYIKDKYNIDICYIYGKCMKAYLNNTDVEEVLDSIRPFKYDEKILYWKFELESLLK